MVLGHPPTITSLLIGGLMTALDFLSYKTHLLQEKLEERNAELEREIEAAVTRLNEWGWAMRRPEGCWASRATIDVSIQIMVQRTVRDLNPN
jgi:hypothetical protein